MKKPLRLTNTHLVIIKTLIHGLSLGFVGNLLYLTISDKIPGDPVDALLHFSGIGSLNLLLIGLAVTPTAKLLRASGLIRIRRLLGLYAFFYAVVHLFTFILFELQLEWGLIINEIIQRPFITVGFLAWIILLLLSLTSTKAVQQKMGKRWQSLHNWIYLAAPLIVIHFYWSVKSEIIEPLIYAIVLLVLFGFRKDKLTKRIRQASKE